MRSRGSLPTHPTCTGPMLCLFFLLLLLHSLIQYHLPSHLNIGLDGFLYTFHNMEHPIDHSYLLAYGNTKIDTNKFGFKMMEKMGWSQGKGLGAKEDGVQEH